MRAGAQRRPCGRDQSGHRAGGKAGDGAVGRSRASRSGGNEVEFVIPGRVEDANPESRDSGFDASHRPGMTKEQRERTMKHLDHPLARRTVIKGAGLGLIAGALTEATSAQDAAAATEG